MNTELQGRILNLMAKYEVNPQERFSQNFLIDKNARDLIVNSLPWGQAEEVVEVGPGLGSLTEALVKFGPKVTAIEFDRDMVKVLSGEIHNSNFSLIQGDFLKQDLSMFHVKQTCYIGNLPYSITRDIIRKIVVNPNYIYFGFMLQKELAEKFFYKEGNPENNPFAVYFALRGTLSSIIELSPGSFYPPPKVSSEFLKFVPNDDGAFASESVFKLLEALYKNPRKNLNNNLKSSPAYTYLLNELTVLGIPSSLRPHQLSLEQVKALVSCTKNKR